MEASVVETAEQNGAPVEGAEATREAIHLFQYSRYVDVGAGAEECEHARDGKCLDPEHFHAWLCLPNPIQRQDILDKAKAAKARRKRAMLDPETDVYAILESELDELLAQDREPLLKELAERDVRAGAVERVGDLIEGEERFNNYWQDLEELERLKALPEEEQPTEELESLQKVADDFEAALDRQTEELTANEIRHLQGLSEEALRGKCRKVRIEAAASETHMRTYYLWLGFVCTKTSLVNGASKRYFDKLDDYRSASPEVVEVVEDTLRDLEGRLSRGDAAGN